MSDIFAARSQMAMSLAFHIMFAVVGIGMPLLMVIAEWQWLKTKDHVYLILAKRWAKGTAIMFAVGAVSGTVLSFELGLLWPKFMEFAGPIVGMPFSMEGFAFFLEAIFLGIYLYGWERVRPWAHWFAGVMVMICGTLSGVFVVTANAWMNTPVGFRMVGGKVVSIDPVAAMWNPAAFSQTLHMTLAAFVAIGFAVAAIHAWMLLKDPTNPFHRRALVIALWVGGVTAFLQPISGDISAKHVAKYQPVKLAAMEGQWETVKGAGLRIGGWPDEKTETTSWALELPYMLSILAFSDPHAEVKGLKAFPKKDRPPVAVVHFAFQIMVGLGFWMMFVALLAAFLAWRRKKIPDDPWFLKLLIWSGPAGILAIQAGWTVTEVGRQPWIVQGIMRTKDAVTPMPGLMVPFLTFSALYFVLGIVVVALLKRQVFNSPSFSEDELTEKAEVPAASAHGG
ncbi:MAG: cytochrome ubiquinol oxidase subunit I [Myxococcales bacterium]|nr:cytochrome ubiquinol oxidase subunit I [Myxococcales bacterium]MCB9644805.1 cytochrome ubiquinol oxidase subunit I [Myxococcales bacterium]